MQLFVGSITIRKLTIKWTGSLLIAESRNKKKLKPRATSAKVDDEARVDRVADDTTYLRVLVVSRR